MTRFHRLLALLALSGLLLGALPALAQAQGLVPDAAAPEDAAPTAGSEVLAPLVDVLEDAEARARLLSALRDSAPTDSSTDNSADGTAAEALEEPEPATFAARLAETSLGAIDTLVERAQTIASDIAALRVLPGLLTPERREVIRADGINLLITILVTVAIYRSLRILSRWVFAPPVAENPPFATLAIRFTGQMVLRFLGVLLAWIAGYGLSYAMSGAEGIAMPQALYLNAFVIFGVFTVGLSTLVSHHPDDLTFAQIPRRTETIVFRSVRRVAGVACYGLIAAVPIVQSWTNFVVARSLRTLILTVFAILAIAAIHKIARTLRAEESARAAADSTGVSPADTPSDDIPDALASNSTRLWNSIWPWLGYLYVVVAYAVSIANPNLVVEIVGRATVFTGFALVAAIFALRLLRLAPQKMRAPVPGILTRLLPTLPDRLAAFVTPSLVVLGGGALAVSGLLLLEGWRLVDLTGWFGTGGTEVSWRIANLALVLAALILFWAVLSSYIDKRLSQDLPENEQVSARSRTLLALFRNTLSIALVIFGGMTLLSEMGVDIAPLLAGAGVIGLAIGFGAQKLVQDIITGVFIQLENAINEGDVVTVAGITGGVEKLTIRSVGIRDLTGTYHIIPFSAVDTVGNYMRRFAYHVEVVGVAYNSDLDATKKALHDAFDALMASDYGADITDPLEYHGVVGLGESSVNLRVRIKTKPGKQWGVGRAYTQEVKRALDAAGIEIPFPHRELRFPAEMFRQLPSPDAPRNASTDPE